MQIAKEISKNATCSHKITLIDIEKTRHVHFQTVFYSVKYLLYFCDKLQQK